jgi:IMP dehydrogenase
VRSSFTYAGARSVPEFRERAMVGIQSAAGYEEGKALPVSW